MKKLDSIVWILALFLVLAEITDEARSTPGLASNTGIAPVKYQPVMGIWFEFFRNYLKQFFLHR